MRPSPRAGTRVCERRREKRGDGPDNLAPPPSTSVAMLMGDPFQPVLGLADAIEPEQNWDHGASIANGASRPYTGGRENVDSKLQAWRRSSECRRMDKAMVLTPLTETIPIVTLLCLF